MAQYIKNADIFGRIGSGIGQGLSEQLPKEIERGRLASGLKELSQNKDMTPFERFAGLASLPGNTPQIIQSGTDLLRQQAVIDSVNKKDSPIDYEKFRPKLNPRQGLSTATTTEGTKSALDPYIPPSGEEQERMARELVANEPNIYPTIESGRAAIANRVSADVNQSNSKLAKRELEESVQNRSEQKLKDEIATVGAQVPGTVLSKLQQKAVDAVQSGKMSPDAAKIHYGENADKISKNFANIRSWGNLGLVTKEPKSLLNSIKTVQHQAKEGGYQKEAAEALIGENGLTPQFAYASMYPVSDYKELNSKIKSLPSMNKGINDVLGQPNTQKINETLKVAPNLVSAMGLEASPLSIMYELDKKGYDGESFKQYLLDNKETLNLSSNQLDELEKPKPSFFGWLNDWWLKSFSGVK
mgnify:CR=1 FL=1